MNRVDRALSCFLDENLSCTQAVAKAYGPSCGLDAEAAAAASRAFGAGMGEGRTCGAVVGALMMLGLAAETKEDEKATRAECADRVRDFASRFRARRGTVICSELLGLDMSTPESRRYAAESGMFREICPRFVRDAAEILEEMLPRRAGP